MQSRTIAEWCADRRVSRSMFYKLRAKGLAPRTYNIGASKRISSEADAEWIKAREAEAAITREKAGE